MDKDKKIEDTQSDQLRRLAEELLYYLNNYNELTKTRPHYKKIVDKEIKAIINAMKALSR